jgi:hypothetical protein
MSMHPSVTFDPLAQGRPPRRLGAAVNRSLGEREAFSIAGRRGTTVRVTQGRVWLTQHGDRTDYVLGAGDAMEFETNGSVVLYGLTQASLQFDTPARAPGVLSRFVAHFIQENPT